MKRPFQNLSSSYLRGQIDILQRFMNTEGIGSYIEDDSFTAEYKKRVQRYEEELNIRGMV